MRHRRKKAPVPRYYLTQLKKSDPDRYETINHKRLKQIKGNQSENTPQRLAAKRAVLTAKTKLLKREL